MISCTEIQGNTSYQQQRSWNAQQTHLQTDETALSFCFCRYNVKTNTKIGQIYIDPQTKENISESDLSNHKESRNKKIKLKKNLCFLHSAYR